MKKVALLSSITLSALALSAASTAQAANSLTDEKKDDKDIVVTASRVEQDRDTIGQAITIIDAEDIARRQEVGVTELLSTTAGVRFSRAGGYGAQTGVSLRGGETQHTLVLIDGVKVNDPSSPGGGYDFGNLMTGNIRRIEVLRGSNSVPYGSDAIGGVVNILTADPEAGLSATGSAEYGYADMINAKGQVGYGTEQVAAQAGLNWLRTDGISAVSPQFGATEHDGFENLTANAKVRIGSGPVSLDLRAIHIAADVDYDQFFGTPADSSDVAKTKQYIGYAGLNVALLDGALHNRFAVSWYRTERDNYFARANSQPDFGYVGKNLRFEYQGVAQPIKAARLVFGYEHEAPEYDGFGFGSTAHEKANMDSVYALAILNPVQPLSITAGLRHDDHSQFGGHTTFGANANLALFQGATNVRIAYGEGFKAPTLYQLYDVWSGNSDLKPETSKSYDIGLDQSLIDGLLSASVTLFRRDTSNFVDYSFETWRYFNVGKIRAEGLEFELAMQPTDTLRMTANYSYIDAVNRDPASDLYGKRLARRAEHAISVSVDQDWRFGLSTGATITHVSGSFSNPANTQPLDGYVLVGLRAAMPITDQVELFGRIDNLFDEQYSTIYGFGTYGRSAYAGVRVRL